MTEAIKLERLDYNFPERATQKELEELGFRYLQTGEFERDGKKSRIEYMVYQDSQKIFAYKRFNQDDLFEFHTEADIVKRAN